MTKMVTMCCSKEKLRVAKEKKELESLKQAVLCASCRNSLQASSVPVARYSEWEKNGHKLYHLLSLSLFIS